MKDSFQINIENEKIVISNNENKISINSNLPKTEIVKFLKYYINPDKEKERQIDKNIVAVSTNKNWSELYFLNEEEQTVLTIDFKNRQVLNCNKNEASKSYINKCNFIINAYDEENLGWIKVFLNLIESIYTYRGNIQKNRYFKEALYNVDKLLCYEVFAKQEIGNFSRFFHSYLDDVSEKIKSNKKFKLYQIFGIKKHQYLLLKEKGFFSSRNELSEIFECLRNEEYSKYLEYLLENNYLHNAYNFHNYMELFENKNIKDNYNIKRLIDYINIDCLHQGIEESREAIRYLYDYVNMNCKMEIKDFIKYPKYLKTYHDIVMMNYNIKLDEIKNRNYKRLIEKNNYLNYDKDKNFEIVVPNTLNDIVKEGSELNHCVASYIDSILEEKTFIVFLRSKQNIDKSLVTAEVKNNQINYARGQGNRNCVSEEQKFIDKYNNYLQTLKTKELGNV